MPDFSEYETAREAAERLGYDYSYFTRLLKAGRVPGAVKWSGWMVPKDVEASEVRVQPGPKRES